MGAPAKPPPSIKSVSCPNCGGTVQLRGMGRTLNAVCIQCLSVLDTTAGVKVVQQFQSKERIQPLIPLGTRGKMRGEPFEAIGFQVRELTADGIAYSWGEYVLFNPFKGFRYLTEYNGHWNDVTVATSTAEVSGKQAKILGESYRHFQHYTAATTYVMGEFPWQVRVGETAECDDYVHPPRILSAERTKDEVTWSIGEYTTGAAIWESFQLKGTPPPARGVFANQPSPHEGSVKAAGMRFFVWFAILLAIQLFFSTFHSNRALLSRDYRVSPQPGSQEASFITESFDVPGRTSNVQVMLDTDSDNPIGFVHMALIEANTSRTLAFSRELSWAAGKRHDKLILPSVPSGRYYMRVEPEMESAPAGTVPTGLHYHLEVRRDVTTWSFFLIGCILLVFPLVFAALRKAAFESSRWAESDYASSGSSSNSGDDE